jgi:hypothetical protein
MSNRRRNYAIWIGWRVFPRHSWGFPLLLPVLEETLEEILEFLSLGKFLFSRVKVFGLIYNLIQTILDLFREMRNLGPFTLVQVRTDATSVDVRLI